MELARQVPASAGPGRVKRGILSHFLTSIVAKHQKIEGGTLWGNFFSKKSLTMPKNWKGDPLVSPGMVCYAKKAKNLFGLVR